MNSIDSHIFEILEQLNVNGLNEECIHEILRTRTETIASLKTAYQRKISDSFELTVIPDKFAVLTFQSPLGTGTVKRVEKAIRIDRSGGVELKAMTTSSAMRAPVGALKFVLMELELSRTTYGRSSRQLRKFIQSTWFLEWSTLR